MSSYIKTIKETSVNAIAQIILVPLVLITLPVLTKNLTIEEYGLWGLIFTTCSLTMPFTSLGLGTAMSRFISSAKNKKTVSDGFVSVLVVRLILSLIIAIIIFLFSEKIANAFFGSNSQIVKIISLFVVITTVEPIFKRFLRIIRHVKVLSSLKIIEGYGALSLYILVFYFGGGLYGIISAILIFKIFLILFIAFYLRNKISYSFPDFSIFNRNIYYCPWASLELLSSPWHCLTASPGSPGPRHLRQTVFLATLRSHWRSPVRRPAPAVRVVLGLGARARVGLGLGPAAS